MTCVFISERWAGDNERLSAMEPRLLRGWLSALFVFIPLVCIAIQLSVESESQPSLPANKLAHIFIAGLPG